MNSIFHPSLNVTHLKNELKLRTCFDFDINVKMIEGYKRFEMNQEEFNGRSRYQYKYLCNLMMYQNNIGNFIERSDKNYLIFCPPGVDYTKPFNEFEEDPCDSVLHPFIGQNLGIRTNE